MAGARTSQSGRGRRAYLAERRLVALEGVVSPMLMVDCSPREQQPHLHARSLHTSVSPCSHARRAGRAPHFVANEWVQCRSAAAVLGSTSTPAGPQAAGLAGSGALVAVRSAGGRGGDLAANTGLGGLRETSMMARLLLSACYT